MSETLASRVVDNWRNIAIALIQFISAGQLAATHLPVYVECPFIVCPFPVKTIENDPVPFSESLTWIVPCASAVP